jgi:hypothetical protein
MVLAFTERRYGDILRQLSRRARSTFKQFMTGTYRLTAQDRYPKLDRSRLFVAI